MKYHKTPWYTPNHLAALEEYERVMSGQKTKDQIIDELKEELKFHKEIETVQTQTIIALIKLADGSVINYHNSFVNPQDMWVHFKKNYHTLRAIRMRYGKGI